VPQGRGTVRLLGADPTAPLSLTVMFRDGATEHLPYRGEAPVGPGEIALPGGIARLLGVDVGETVTAIGPTGEQATLTLVGGFDPPERDDPFWYGDQTPFPPPDSTELPEALRFASRVVLFRDGKVEAEGRPEEISARLTVD